jgi:hypothetical protein
MYKFPVREEERERESDMSRGKITASVFLRAKKEKKRPPCCEFYVDRLLVSC